MTRTPSRLSALVGLLALIALLVAAPAALAAGPSRALSPADRAARAKLLSGLGRQPVFDEDPQTRTPRALLRLDGPLTPARQGDPADIALGYVSGHAGALGLGAEDVASLHPAGRVTAGGVTYLRWSQEVGGIPSIDNELRAGVDAEGRVVAVLGAPRRDLTAPDLTPALDAGGAMAALAKAVGSDRQPSVTAGPTGPRHETRFSTGDVAKLVLTGEAGPARLAWHLTFDAGPDAWYDAVVDATTGQVLRQANMVKHIAASVFSNYPGAPAGGTQQPVTLDAFLNPGVTTTLTGPNAHAWADLNDLSPTAPIESPSGVAEEVRPASYTFQSVDTLGAAQGCDATHHCSWDPGTASSWNANREESAVQAFWFVNTFHNHLNDPPISFTRAWGNLEGAANGVDVQTDDGANFAGAGLPDANHVDNANMTTPPEGLRPRLQLNLFGAVPSDVFRAANSADDASAVYHEYTHGMSNRLITDPADGSGALTQLQSSAMGEGWSDFYAKDFLVRQGLQPDTAAPGEVDMGAYLDRVPNSVRTQPLDCPVGSTSPRCPGTINTAGGGYTYADFGRIFGHPEPHADGEIWGETLWDLRSALGSDMSEQLVTDGMRLSPPEPSMLEERNAIMLADQADFAGAHIGTLWAVFARRGMGVNASTRSAADPTPVPDFTVPGQGAPAPPVTLVGGATPQPAPVATAAVATVQAVARPTARIAASSVNGRALVTIGCATACSATATMSVGRATARRVRLGSTTRLARVTRRLAARGRRTFSVSISARTLRRLRSRGVRSLATTVSVSVRDGRGQTRTLRQAVRVRVR